MYNNSFLAGFLMMHEHQFRLLNDNKFPSIIQTIKSQTIMLIFSGHFMGPRHLRANLWKATWSDISQVGTFQNSFDKFIFPFLGDVEGDGRKLMTTSIQNLTMRCNGSSQPKVSRINVFFFLLIHHCQVLEECSNSKFIGDLALSIFDGGQRYGNSKVGRADVGKNRVMSSLPITSEPSV